MQILTRTKDDRPVAFSMPEFTMTCQIARLLPPHQRQPFHDHVCEHMASSRDILAAVSGALESMREKR